MATTKVAAKYAEAFVNSAGEVSPIFERKARTILEENGIKHLGESDWLTFSSFVAALSEVEDEVGEMTLREGGKKMARVNDLPDHINTVDGALEYLNDSHQQAHKNGSEEEWGSYIVERLDDRRFRMSCSAGYPYPYALAKGVFEGIVKEFGAGDISLTVREVSETDLNLDEGFAVDITW
jgi:hypothetical protein